jgi:formylmethanofuran dehydrogenase subunit A
LLINDPWHIFLTTDHPNGGCFWRYPEIIELLMCADARKKGIRKLSDKVKGKITLPEIDREYTLYEVAISMSAGNCLISIKLPHPHNCVEAIER